jgi:pimeloyl-ACP methyl ester carboxylesterase/DNA-binding SARP family transcriptional activator/class 3 adenylate cyclase/tetratricopeptide (TPR) repeat protein
MKSELQICVLGDFAVMRGDQPVELPPSRKTRALLAYLAVVDRPQRRERLCEMFWEIPDDPRGALRWSLSKIRQILKPDADRDLHADRNMVALECGTIGLDIAPLKGLAPREVDRLDTGTLEDLAARFRGGFLDGLVLPRCPDYEAWRIAIAEEMEVLRLRILRVLVDRLRSGDPARALTQARVLQSLSDHDPDLDAEITRLAEAARHAATAVAPKDGGPGGTEPAPPAAPPAAIGQDIRQCTTRDGVQLAYAVSGKGPPLVRAAHWMSHVEQDWNSPVWGHWLKGLSARHTLVRYDERGNGLSDWDVADLSFDSMVADLEDIVDAAGLRQFCLLGVSQSCAVSIAYAARHRERVTGLILYGGYAQGWRARGNEPEIRRREAMGTLIRDGWGQQDPVFRQLFTSLFIPGASQEQMDWFNELQRQTVSPHNAERFHEAFGRIDVTALLPRIAVPTLVVHARDDRVVPLEAGAALAQAIPGARMVVLDSANHILLDHEPAFRQFLDEVERFAADPGPRPAAPAVDLQLDHARRQVTVMAAEVVSPLQAFEAFDAELALRETGPLLEAVATAIREHDGTVTVGADGSIMAIFGLSKATEDHAYLACRAALVALSAVEEHSQGSARLRVGLDTGEVIVRQRQSESDGADEVVGTVPRHAGRLMRALRRATVAMTARARVAAGGYVRTVAMAPADHPGLSRDEQAWELMGENRALSRWYMRVNKGLTALVSREAELAGLGVAWRRAREGHGQVVGIVADPGVGKSRLVHEFISGKQVAGFTVIESGALEIDANAGFMVVKKLVRAACGLDVQAAGAAAGERLARLCRTLGLDGLTPSLAALLDLPADSGDWQNLDGTGRMARIQESVVALLAALAQQSPLVVLIEDLHWIDAASETVIERMIDAVAGQRILLVLTYRPSYRHDWLRRSIFQQIRLEPFDAEETERFLDALLGGDATVRELKPLLIQRGESTPLFLEEMVQVLEAKGHLAGTAGAFRMVRGIDDVTIPDTMKSVIAARIDQLAPAEKRLVQIAAVIGREVPKTLLQSLSSLPIAAFDAALSSLRDQEILFEIQSYPAVELSFKHALIQKMTYAGLLEQERRLVHRSTLRAMEHLYRDSPGEYVERLAEHAVRAEEWDSAVTYLVQAADRAIEQSGYDRAAPFLESALLAADRLPPSRARSGWAVDIRTRLRPVYEATGEFAKAVERLEEARSHADEMEDEERLFRVLIHQSYLYSAHGRVEQALEAADTLKLRAQRHRDGQRFVSEADLAAAQAHLMRADARSAVTRLQPHYEPFTRLWRNERFGQLGIRSVWYLGNLAQAEATLGNFGPATDAAALALEIADEHRRPVDVYAARYFAALVDILRGPSRERCEELRAMVAGEHASAAQSMRPWLLAALGHVELSLGDHEAAAATLEAVITEAERFDLPQFECYARALLACTRTRLGEPEAEANLEHGLRQARLLQDRWSEITLLRGLAETVDDGQAETLLEEACRLAEQHGYRPELARCLHALASLEERIGRPSAVATQQKAGEMAAEMDLRMPAATMPVRPVPAKRSRRQSSPAATT